MKFHLFCIYLIYNLIGEAVASELHILAEDMPPLQIVENGKLVSGMALDRVNLARLDCGHPSSIEVVPWARGYKQTLTTPNTALFSMMRTPNRESLFKWAGPIIELKFQAFALKKRSDIQISEFDDVRNFVSGVIRDDFVHQILTLEGKSSDAKIYPASDMQLLVKLLYMERIDLIFVADIFLQHHIKNLNYDLEKVQPKFTFRQPIGGMYLAFNKNTPASLIQCYNKALNQRN